MRGNLGFTAVYYNNSRNWRWERLATYAERDLRDNIDFILVILLTIIEKYAIILL